MGALHTQLLRIYVPVAVSAFFVARSHCAEARFTKRFTAPGESFSSWGSSFDVSKMEGHNPCRNLDHHYSCAGQMRARFVKRSLSS